MDKHRFYVEVWAHGWTVYDRTTDTNDGWVHPNELAAIVAASKYDANPARFEEERAG
jgi:hypothetical protein